MEKKFKLHSIGNSEKFNYYIFSKKQKVAIELSKIFFNVLKMGWDFHTYDGGKIRKNNIENYKDIHDSFSNLGTNNKIDIFYGDKKMFIVVRCSQKLRLKLNEELEAITFMPKPKKLNKGKFFK